MTDRVIEALREIAPVTRGEVTVKGDGEVRKLYAEGRMLRLVAQVAQAIGQCGNDFMGGAG